MQYDTWTLILSMIENQHYDYNLETALSTCIRAALSIKPGAPVWRMAVTILGESSDNMVKHFEIVGSMDSLLAAASEFSSPSTEIRLTRYTYGEDVL